MASRAQIKNKVEETKPGELDDKGFFDAVFELDQQDDEDPDADSEGGEGPKADEEPEPRPEVKEENVLEAYAGLLPEQLKMVCDIDGLIHHWAIETAGRRQELTWEYAHIGTIVACEKVVQWNKSLAPFVVFVKGRAKGAMVDYRRKLSKWERRWGQYQTRKQDDDGEEMRISNERISIGALFASPATVVTNLPISPEELAMGHEETDEKIQYLTEKYEKGVRGAVIILDAIRNGISLRKAGRGHGWTDNQIRSALRSVVEGYRRSRPATAQDRTPIGRTCGTTMAARRKKRWRML